MKGYFVFNKYLETDKFKCLKNAYSDEAKALGIDIEFISNSNALQLNYDNKLDIKDFILFWDKDVKLAKILEDRGHRVINSSNAISLCDDKSKTYIILLKNNIRQPMTIISPLIFYGTLDLDIEFINFSIVKLGFPMIVKECFGSFGEQVYLVNSKEELTSLIKNLGTKPFILQEFIKTSYGKDIRVEVVGNEVVATVFRQNDQNDFRANITNGANAIKYTPNSKQIDIALKACKCLGLDFGGVDILFGENDEPILCEVNSNAYPLNVQKITGVNIIKLTLEHIKNKVK